MISNTVAAAVVAANDGGAVEIAGGRLKVQAEPTGSSPVRGVGVKAMQLLLRRAPAPALGVIVKTARHTRRDRSRAGYTDW